MDQAWARRQESCRRSPLRPRRRKARTPATHASMVTKRGDAVDHPRGTGRVVTLRRPGSGGYAAVVWVKPREASPSDRHRRSEGSSALVWRSCQAAPWRRPQCIAARHRTRTGPGPGPRASGTRAKYWRHERGGRPMTSGWMSTGPMAPTMRLSARSQFDELSRERAGLMEQQTNLLLSRISALPDCWRRHVPPQRSRRLRRRPACPAGSVHKNGQRVFATSVGMCFQLCSMFMAWVAE